MYSILFLPGALTRTTFVPGLTRFCAMDVIGDETLMIVGVPDPAGIMVFIGELVTTGLG
jgi:hypothetical protein